MLAPWKSYDQPRQHIKKQRYYSANKGPSNQSYGFSSSHVWMWELVYKKTWRINAFELWCWRRLLKVPWIARRSYQSILKQISPEYSLERLMLKLKFQYFGHLMRTDSLWPMDCSTPGFPVHHQLPELAQLMSIESVIPSNHFILCHPLVPSVFPSIKVFSKESVLIRWPKYWNFSFSISLSSE